MSVTRITIISLFSVLLLSSCSGLSSLDSKAEYPLNQEDRRRERLGKLTGEGGLVLFDKKGSEETAGSSAGIGINSYLWRATLDVLSFMPLASADPFGGVILTDWYQDPATPNERFKINVFILDQKLRSNALKITVFKQLSINNGRWKDAKVDPSVAREIEDKILTRARELRTQVK